VESLRFPNLPPATGEFAAAFPAHPRPVTVDAILPSASHPAVLVPAPAGVHQDSAGVASPLHVEPVEHPQCERVDFPVEGADAVVGGANVEAAPECHVGPAFFEVVRVAAASADGDGPGLFRVGGVDQIHQLGEQHVEGGEVVADQVEFVADVPLEHPVLDKQVVVPLLPVATRPFAHRRSTSLRSRSHVSRWPIGIGMPFTVTHSGSVASHSNTISGPVTARTSATTPRPPASNRTSPPTPGGSCRHSGCSVRTHGSTAAAAPSRAASEQFCEPLRPRLRNLPMHVAMRRPAILSRHQFGMPATDDLPPRLPRMVL